MGGSPNGGPEMRMPCCLVVNYLVDTGANHVLVTKGGAERWIPYIEPFLVSVDKQKKVITVDWDENY